MSETVLSATAIQFFVHGLPIPQGSKKVIGRNVIEMADARLRSWRQDVASTAKSVMAQEGAEAGIEPVDVRLMFFLPRPQGHYGSGRNANRLKPSAPATPAVHPDLDKLVRSVLDALTGVCFRDDKQVVSLTAAKLYSDGDSSPGLMAAVMVLTPGRASLGA
jgi:Holliday junction resolvase RusA-like endonuclease